MAQLRRVASRNNPREHTVVLEFRTKTGHHRIERNLADHGKDSVKVAEQLQVLAKKIRKFAEENT